MPAMHAKKQAHSQRSTTGDPIENIRPMACGNSIYAAKSEVTGRIGQARGVELALIEHCGRKKPPGRMADTQQHNGGVPEGVTAGVTAAPFDGYAEAWFPNMEAVYKVIGSTKWAEIVAKDDENFLDRSKTLVLFSEEKVDYNA